MVLSGGGAMWCSVDRGVIMQYGKSCGCVVMWNKVC